MRAVRVTVVSLWLVVLAPAGVLSAPRDAVRAWRRSHEAAILGELAAFAALPNLCADSADARRNVGALVVMLERRGLTTSVLGNGPWPPAVLGEHRVPGAKHTVVFYAHYDGQPVTPSEWRTPPWEPTLRVRDGSGWRTVPIPTGSSGAALDPESRLFARSAADDKGPIVAILAALDALNATRQRPTVNVKLFLEGEEESGSTHLGDLVRRHRDRLAADAWLFCDGPVHASRQLQLVFGARGVMGLEMVAYGPARPVHSGHYGNWAPNPALLLARALASLRDEDGRILIDGFYDDVAPITDADRAALAALPNVDLQWREELELGGTEAGDAPLAGRVLLPALNVRGLTSGHVGAEAANVIPAEARASIDFRLVPYQTSSRVRDLVEAHLTKQGWFVTSDSVTAEIRRSHARVMRLTWEQGYAAYRVPLDNPIARSLRATVDEWLGKPALAVPMQGGSLPLSTLADAVRSPFVIVPIVNHDDDQHSHDENLRLQNLWDGVELYAAIMTRLERHWVR
jgi:acetylornithine deacetylase/succinyl-diaminopimelate desuccinylase-like protein